MTLREPLSPTVAKAHIRSALATGEVRFSGHAEAEMAKDDLTAVDRINVLRGGIVQQPELERGTWRYRSRRSESRSSSCSGRSPWSSS